MNKLLFGPGYNESVLYGFKASKGQAVYIIKE